MKIAAKTLCSMMAATAVMWPGYAMASAMGSDTGMEALEYIENRYREDRAHRLSDEQKQLLADAKALSENLRQPLDEKAPLPVAFEGDDLTYDERTGEFIAKGNVDILQMDARRFQAEEVTGNIKEHVVRVPDRAHVLQLPPKEVRVTLDGYRAVYNYGTKTGTMDDARGKAGSHYVTGKRIEFYPDRVVIYDGTETRCGANEPDYHLSAEKIEIWPNDRVKMYHVKFWAGKMVVATRKYYEKDISKADGDRQFPRVGYNKDHGAYIEQDFRHSFSNHFSANLHAHVETKKGVRSNGELDYQNRDFSARTVYGYFEDGDNLWIQKEPGLILDYGRRFGKSPYAYHLQYEVGHWRSDNATSLHQCYSIGLSRDPIEFHRWILFLGTGYSVTRESYDRSIVRGLNYDAVLARDFDPKWAAFIGYHYKKSTKENSVFAFGLDDYSRKLDTGLSYRMDRLNRFAIGLSFDTGSGNLRDVDYYWYHDLHCSQVVLRYRGKRDKFEVHWQFTPW